jgi:DNA-binding NtrC family response regulator
MSQPKPKTSPPGKNSKTLLFVVDDEPMLLELALIVLEPLGFIVKTFRDPATALREYTAANPRPAVIVTDFAMHNMTGLDLIKGCRQINPKQKVVLVSGTVDESMYQDSLVKPDRFLAKPYRADQLPELIESVLAQ